MSRTPLLFGLMLCLTAATAQNATIARFKFWTADTAYSIWRDTSTVFLYKAPDGSMGAIPTADTLFTYTCAQLNKRLDMKLDTLTVDGTVRPTGQERIIGFPDRKVKAVLADGKYGQVVDIEVLVFAVPRKSENPRKKTPDTSIEMRITVETFDGAGHRTAKYMERTRASELKPTPIWQNGYDADTGLTGDQVMALYVAALENALNSKR